jgi:hypothetical protein
MTKPGPIDFWFSIGSLYSYLSVIWLDRIAPRRLHVRFTPESRHSAVTPRCLLGARSDHLHCSKEHRYSIIRQCE